MTYFSSDSLFPFNFSLSLNTSFTEFASTLLVFQSAHLFTSSPSPSANSTSPIITNQNISSFDKTFHLLLAVSYLLFFLFGLVGNLFALWVFFFLSASRNSLQVFLINCAVADLLLLACLPFRVFYHVNKNEWVFGQVACKIVGNLFYINMYISITLLGFISLDRFIRLKSNVRVKRVWRMTLCGHSLPWSWAACGTLWCLSGVTAVILTSSDLHKLDDNHCFEYKQLLTAQGKRKAYFNAVVVGMFWFVLLMLIVSYTKVAFRLLRVSRNNPDLPNAVRYKRTAKKSFFVLFVYIICFGPYHTFRPIYIMSQVSEGLSHDYMQLMDRTNEVVLLLSAFNSCLDPILYFLLSGTVRKLALRALGNRLARRVSFLNATSVSSLTECQRSTIPMNLQITRQKTPTVTPRASTCVINPKLLYEGPTILLPISEPLSHACSTSDDA